MTTIRLHLGWPVRRLLCFDFSLSPRELEILENRRSRYVRMSNNNGIVDIVNMFRGNNHVEDVDRYRIRHMRERLRLIPHQQREVSPETNRHNDIRPQQGGNTLVVLLESPSAHEYNGAPNHPIAPAQGQTGCGLLCHLDNLLDKAIQTLDDDNYLQNHLLDDTRVVISNPIQFETSLRYAIHEKVLPRPRRETLRDRCFKKLWNDVPQIRWRFLKRLQIYNPSIIINSCTSGLSPLARISHQGG